MADRMRGAADKFLIAWPPDQSLNRAAWRGVVD